MTPKALPNLPGQAPAPGLPDFPSLGKPPSRDDAPCPRAVLPAWAGAQSTRVRKADGRPHGSASPSSARLCPARGFQDAPACEGHGCRLPGPIHLCRPSVLDSSAPGTWPYWIPPSLPGILGVQSPCSGRPSGRPAHLGGPCAPAQPLVPLSPRGWNHRLSPRALPQLHTKMGPRAGFAGRWVQVAFHSLSQGGGAGPGSRVLAKHAVCARKDPAGSPPQGPGLGTGPPAAELTQPRPPSRSKNPKHPSHLGRHQAEPPEGGKHLCS